jgi:hypothetical protein
MREIIEILINKNLKIKDFVYFRLDKDREDIKDLKRYLNVKEGDFVLIVALKKNKI